jgi:anti-sigma factor RsiW
MRPFFHSSGVKMSGTTPHSDPFAPGLLAAFGRVLAAEEARLEPVSDEEIDAYVDGTADEGERALMAERLARDPALAALIEDLGRLRAELEAEAPAAAPRVLPFRRPARQQPAAPAEAPVRTSGSGRLALGALAAAALVAAIVVGPQGRPAAAPSATVARAATAPASAGQPIARLGEKAQFVRSASEFERAAKASSELFADGFEAGSAAGWTGASGG